MNTGIQYQYLDEVNNEKGHWDEEDYEEVYLDTVLDGWGHVKKDPIHILVPEVLKKAKLTSSSSVLTGLRGFLEMLQSPYTSEDPEVRWRQILVILMGVGIRFYRFLIQQMDSCPSIILGSTEPSTQKTATAMLALKILSDVTMFMAPGSSVPSVDLLKSFTSNFNLIDDIDNTETRKKIIMDSYNGAVKTTIERGEEVKLSGQIFTLNFTPKDRLLPKEDEGRTWIMVFSKIIEDPEDFDEAFESRMAHNEAMQSRGSPRDFLSYLGCKMFKKEEGQRRSVWQQTHKEASRIIKDLKPGYGSRKVDTYAIPLTVFMMINREVELVRDSDTESVHHWVRSMPGGIDVFLEKYMKELDRTDAKVAELLSASYPGNDLNLNESEVENGNEDKMTLEELESKLMQIVKIIKDEEVSMVEVKKVINVHNDNNQFNLSIAHNRCKKSFIKKSWKELNFQSSGFASGPKNKIFVKENGTKEKGAKDTGTVFCFQFNIELFEEEFKAAILDMFKPSPLKQQPNYLQPSLSQDFPEVTEGSQMKCELCEFLSSTAKAMKDHVVEHHVRCPKEFCRKLSKDQKDMDEHMKNEHGSFDCNICQKKILQKNRISHREYHESQKDYGEVIESGKVSKIKPKEKESIDMKMAWSTYQRKERPAAKDYIENKNPEKNKTDKAALTTKHISLKWNKLTKTEKEEWWRKEMKNSLKASQKVAESGGDEETSTETPEKERRGGTNNTNENVINLTEADNKMNRILKCQICGQVCLGEQRLLKHMLDKHRNSEPEDDSIQVNDENDETEEDVDSIEIVDEATENQCQICGQVCLGEQDLKKHMLDKHRNAEPEDDSIQVNDEAAVIQVMAEIHETEEDVDSTDVDEATENQLVADIEEPNGDLEEDTTEALLEDEIELVLVTRKSKQWPGKVISRKGDQIEVELLNRYKTKVTLNMNEVEAFRSDDNLYKKSSTDLQKAFKKAFELQEGFA